MSDDGSGVMSGSGGGSAEEDEPGTECGICATKSTEGFTRPCCQQFVCKGCIDQAKDAALFKRVGGAALCIVCSKPLEASVVDGFAQWGIADSVLHPPVVDTSSKSRDAWNFKLYHSCGYEYVVIGWSECDVLADACKGCGDRKATLTGAEAAHSYQLRDLLNALSGFEERSSPSIFAKLKTQYPNAWKALHLSELIAEAASNPSVMDALDLWSPGAQKFIKARATQIKALIG